MHYGIDVSSNNAHPIDYPKAVAYLRQLGGGAQPFAIVKATQGTGYTNPDFTIDVHGFAAAGAAIGAYLMDQGNAAVAAEETYFRKVAGGLPQFDDDELPMGNTAYAQHCAALVAQNPAALDYLNQSEENTGFPPGAGIWEANYNGRPGVTHRAALIHQYADNGTVAGISGPVDMNVWCGTEAQFAQVFHLTASPAPSGPSAPIFYPEDNLQQVNDNVSIAGGEGWAAVPTALAGKPIVSVIVYAQDPTKVGYLPLPAFVGYATDGQKLLFGPGAHGPAPDGVYGFTIFAGT